MTVLVRPSANTTFYLKIEFICLFGFFVCCFFKQNIDELEAKKVNAQSERTKLEGNLKSTQLAIIFYL